MNTIKYISKTPTYQLNDKRNSIIQNPIVEPSDIVISWKNNKIRIPFTMHVLNATGKKVYVPEGAGEIHFGIENTETIVDYAGTEMEIEEALQAGWTYDINLVISWGHPSFKNALHYFDITVDGLKFVDGIFGQIGSDFIINKVQIEGVPIKENFELQTL